MSSVQLNLHFSFFFCFTECSTTLLKLFPINVFIEFSMFARTFFCAIIVVSLDAYNWHAILKMCLFIMQNRYWNILNLLSTFHFISTFEHFLEIMMQGSKVNITESWFSMNYAILWRFTKNECIWFQTKQQVNLSWNLSQMTLQKKNQPNPKPKFLQTKELWKVGEPNTNSRPGIDL